MKPSTFFVQNNGSLGQCAGDFIRRLFSPRSLCWRFLLLLLAALSVQGTGAAQLEEARVSQVIRDVKILPKQAAARPARISDEVRDGSAVRTGVESRAELTFTDQTLARLGANTIFTFNEGTRNLELGGGAMLLRVPKNAGGAQINTAAVTAAITGTTIMLEYHHDAFIKFIVLEGTGRVFRNDRVGESVLVKAGQMLIASPKGMMLPNPVDVDIARLKKTSALLSKDFKPIPSNDLITAGDQGAGEAKSGTSAARYQSCRFRRRHRRDLGRHARPAGSGHQYHDRGKRCYRTDSDPRAHHHSHAHGHPYTYCHSDPDATPTPTMTPSPTETPTPSPTATPSVSSVTYNGDTGNWSDSTKWTPGIVPNNGNNGVDYDVNFSSGTLTQDIADGVTINQLFMSGGTLILANPLTLEVGLQFSGGSITSGILNVAGISSQSALLTVDNTIINNSGSYDLVLNGNAFSGGGSTFNNSGILTAHATDGTVEFNIPLVNSGTVSAEFGNLVLTGGGTLSGIASAASDAVLQFGSDFTITDGAQFAGAGLVQFNDSTSTTLSGTITNNGNILLNSTGSFTDFVLSDNVTLSGSGVLSLVAADRIRGTGIFTNAGTTIEGETSNAGSLGADEIGIVNQAGGVISANVSGLTLIVDPNATDGLVNQGTMQAINGGNLLLSGNGGGTFTNSGTIKASGGTLQFDGAVTSSGTVDVGADTLLVTGSYTQSAGTFRLAGGSVTSTPVMNFEGGLVDAWGTINAAITNSANLQPALGGTGLTVNGRLALLASSQLTFQLGGLTQGSEYGRLNVNGTLALGGQLVLTFANGFENSVSNTDNFAVLNSFSVGLGGRFTNVAPGDRLDTSDGFGSFQVDYDATRVVLSNFIPNGVFLDFAGANSATGTGGNGRSLTFSAPAVTFGSGAREYHGASFNGGNGAPGTNFLGGDGGSLAATATTGDVIVNSDIEASSGMNGKDVIGGKGGSVTLTANAGQVAINNRVQVSHNSFESAQRLGWLHHTEERQDIRRRNQRRQQRPAALPPRRCCARPRRQSRYPSHRPDRQQPGQRQRQSAGRPRHSRRPQLRRQRPGQPNECRQFTPTRSRSPRSAATACCKSAAEAFPPTPHCNSMRPTATARSSSSAM